MVSTTRLCPFHTVPFPYCTSPILYLFYNTVPLPCCISSIPYLICTERLPRCTSSVLSAFHTVPLPHRTSSMLYLLILYLFHTVPLLALRSAAAPDQGRQLVERKCAPDSGFLAAIMNINRGQGGDSGWKSMDGWMDG